MFCPECRSEFEAWVSRCPDCDVPLVAELPAEPPHDAPDLRVVLETSDPDVLPIATSALRAAGIPFWTPGEETVGVLPLGTGGGMEPSNLISAGILVPVDRYEEAMAILDTIARPVDAAELDETRDDGGEGAGDASSGPEDGDDR